MQHHRGVASKSMNPSISIHKTTGTQSGLDVEYNIAAKYNVPIDSDKGF